MVVPPTAGKQDTSYSATVVRGLKVISCFDADTDTLSNAEIAERLGLPRPTVARLCKSLMQEGFLLRAPNGRFRLGMSILKLAYPILASMPWRQSALPFMRELAASIGGAVSMATISGNDLIFVQTVRANDGMSHAPEIGMSAPLPIAAMGRALLSLLPDDELEAKICDGREAYPDIWKTYEPAVRDAIARCRGEDGFCVALGDWRAGFYGAGAPLARLSDGMVVAINCGVPAFRVAAETFESDIALRLASVAQIIRTELG